MFKFYLYKIAHFFANRLPLNLLYKLAVILSDIQYVFSFRDRRAVRDNLRIILPHEQNIEPLTREVFRNFGRYLSEFFRMDKMVDEEFIARNVKIENIEYIQQVLNQGKGGIIVTAHIGNWEMGAVVLSLLGYPIMAVALPHKERPVNDLFNNQRLAKGITVISTNGAIRKCMDHLKKNNLVAIVADRDFTVKGGELIDFMGTKSMIPKGSAIFCLKTGAPILPTFIIREKDNSFRLFITEPIVPLPEEEKLPEEYAVRSIMRRYLTVIEDQIRQHPTQWLMFRRFAVSEDNCLKVDDKKICVLIPVLNESQTIAQVVGALRAKNLDVVVIDDGSTDNSGLKAREAGAFVIRHEKKQGKGNSLRDGFRYILEQDYNAVITMDGDGQHAPEDIDLFFDSAGSEGFAMVVGNRMAHPKGMPGVRYLTNRFMSFLISLACRQDIPDTQCGYRYIHRDILSKVSLSCGDFEVETEMLMKAAKRGFQINSVPIRTIYRNEESKINPVKDTFRFIAYFCKELTTPSRKSDKIVQYGHKESRK